MSLLLVLAAVTGQAQVLFSQSFDTTSFPPTGWTRANSASNTFNSQTDWLRVTGGPGGGASNPTPATHSGAGMAFLNTYWISSGGTAELRTHSLNFSSAGLKVLNFWVYNYQNTSFGYNDKLEVYVNTTASSSGGTLLSTIYPNSIGSTQGWVQYTASIPATFTGTSNYIIFKGTSNYGYDIFLDDVSVVNYPPCSGTPTAGTISASSTTACPNGTVTLTTTGTTVAANLAFQWLYLNTATSTWVPVVGGTGGTTNTYITAPINGPIQYRLMVTCSNTGGGTDTTAPITVSVNANTLPYTETFESITSNNQLPQCMAATNLGSYVYTYTSNQGSYNRTNHTPSGSKFASFRYGANDWIFTPAINLTAGSTYRFSYWYVTDGLSGWNSINAAYGTSQNASGMTSIINTVTSPNNSSYQQAIATFTASTTGTYYFGINVSSTFSPWYLTIDDIGLVELPPCTGTPVVTTSPSDSLIVCPTGAYTLTTPIPAVSGLTYQWDSSLNGTSWSPITTGGGNYNYSSSSPGAGAVTYYRLNVTCTNGGGTTTTSPIKVIATAPTPASIPYFNGFETWNNFCTNSDVPSGGNWWQPNNSSGNASWRRNDQGGTAGWTNATSGMYSPAAQSGSYSARFHAYSTGSYTPQFGFDEGQLDMYVNAAPYTGNLGLYFQHINQSFYRNDSLNVWYSTNNGLTWNYAAGWDTANAWRRRVVNIPAGSANTIIRFAARKWGPYDYYDVGIDSVYVAPPCTGTPVAGNIGPSGTQTLCPGSTASFSLTGTSMAGNILVTWEMSSTSATTGFTAVGTAGSNYSFTTPALIAQTWVRAKVTCGATGTAVYSNVVQINMSGTITPGTLPYTEDFESWSTRCSTSDIPSAAWTNAPSTGNASWRREDQGSTANWTSPTTGAYAPAFANGSHSARFHNYYASPDGSTGTLDLYVNCSSVTGNKELQFYANMNANPTYAQDSLRVLYSINGGQTFTQLASIQSTQGWQLYTYVLPSNAANTVIRFQGRSYQYVNDIGLDYVRVLPPCSGTPVAGTVVPVSPCSGQNFTLKTQNTSPSAGLTYQWQKCTQTTAIPAPAKGSGCWTNITGATTAQYTTSQTANTWYRVIVSCSNTGGGKDTTVGYFAQIAPFYQCYCQSSPFYPNSSGAYYYGNIGNVTLKTVPAQAVILNNGTGTPIQNNLTSTNSYTPFYNLTPTPLYRDSTYRASVQQISYYTAYSAGVAVWIDYNQDGQFDPIAERVYSGTTSPSTVPNYNAQGNFTIPSNAKVGVTGMRVSLNDYYGTNTIPPPCGAINQYGYGEVEDYLVEIRFPPCNGAPGAGIAYASDTSACSGYYVTVADTTYQKNRYGIVRTWQQSTNNGASWQNVTNGQNVDSVSALVTSATWYRLRVRCSLTGDSSFSSIVTISLNQPYQCYCVSYADGGQYGTDDSSDVGSFKIASEGGSQSYLVSVGGPHLINPVATRGRTDYTNTAFGTNGTNYMELWADSNYNVDVYHIMRGYQHKDAQVSLFMDFNNNLKYETNPGGNYPSERVLSRTNGMVSGVNSWYMTGTIHIPSQQIITNTPTGMRLIINDNVAPNIPSDDGCGVYKSGETEDYVVVFRKVGGTQGVSGIANLSSLGLFPNPTNGTTTLSYTADKAVKELDITVTNMTGQVMMKQHFNAPGKQFSTNIDLTDRPRGMYFIELRADGNKLVRKLVLQ